MHASIKGGAAGRAGGSATHRHIAMDGAATRRRLGATLSHLQPKEAEQEEEEVAAE